MSPLPPLIVPPANFPLQMLVCDIRRIRQPVSANIAASNPRNQAKCLANKVLGNVNDDNIVSEGVDVVTEYKRECLSQLQTWVARKLTELSADPV